jgi:hypothetical protein
LRKSYYYNEHEGQEHLAATQHNLNALRSLQLDAGLERGIVVCEAFPFTKDASTTVHAQRMENRHPMVGVADPRIDMLASLAALSQMGRGTVPKAALEKLRSCNSVYWNFTSFEGVLDELLKVDGNTGQVVVPAQLEASARGDNLNQELDEFVYLSGAQYPDRQVGVACPSRHQLAPGYGCHLS